MRTRAAVAGLLLGGAVALADPPVGQVLVLTNGVPATPVLADSTSAPVNVVVVATLMRHRPTKKVSLPPEKVIACRTLPELAQTLRSSGTLEVLCHARREVACRPTAQAEFLITEGRPAFILNDDGGTPTNQVFGLEIHTQVWVVPPATAVAPRLVGLAWEGSWSGSVTLLGEWEKFAARGFTLLHAVPGVAYTKVEEDEDGFVSTGGGANLGGLFGRKSKNVGKKEAVDAVQTAGHEPSYLSDISVDKYPFHGEWLGTGGQLLISRAPWSVGKDPSDLYLVLQSRLAD